MVGQQKLKYRIGRRRLTDHTWEKEFYEFYDPKFQFYNQQRVKKHVQSVFGDNNHGYIILYLHVIM